MSGDVLLLVDLLDDFSHEDGQALLSSLRRRHEGMARLLEAARDIQIPVVFANDNRGVWDGDADRLIRGALGGLGGALMTGLQPRTGERFVIKPRYSAFDHTLLQFILDELDCQRLIIAGMTTEGCVAQTAIAARERGMKVSVVAAACATVDPTNEQTALRYLTDVVAVKLADDLPAEGSRASG